MKPIDAKKQTHNRERSLTLAHFVAAGLTVMMMIAVAGLVAAWAEFGPANWDSDENPPLRFEDENPVGSPGPGGSLDEWDRYYRTPSGQEQLLRDVQTLDHQLEDPAKRERVRQILEKQRRK